ncbi:MAG TPA: glycosyltransferase [Methylibium sp.]|nr:glycosyltransferase [Methylibium sp.]
MISIRSALRRLSGRPAGRGRIDGLCHGVAWGWAVGSEHPARPIEVELLLDGQVVGRAPADALRPDVTRARASGQRCGYTLDLRPHLDACRGQVLSLRDAGNGEPLGSTLTLLPGGGSGVVERISGIDVLGWAVSFAPGSAPVEVELLVDGQVAGTARADLERADFRAQRLPTVRAGFRCPLPPQALDGRPHSISARLRGSTAPLSGRALEFSGEVRGYVDTISRERIAGWIANLGAPAEPVRFDLRVNGQRVAVSQLPTFERKDVETSLFPTGTAVAPLGFDVRLPASLRWGERANLVEVCVSGRDEPLLPLSGAVEPLQVIRGLEGLAAEVAARASGDDPQQSAVELALRQQLAQAIEQLRRQHGRSPVLVHGARAAAADEPVDVIVPVYKGYDETLACLRSAIAARDDGPAMELIVIHDAGPDLKLAAELRRLAADGAFTLIENEKNLGFVATVNRGMRLHPKRDVVLLNADTVLPRDWLARLQRAARAEPNIATVTPLSNRATIFSLPRTCIDNPMPDGADVHRLDALCHRLNDGVRVDVPTAMGFCMYVRRTALEEVGLFDEERWAKGYAEENDFSVRATARGWRHVAACDLFVEHHGSVSFAGEKSARVAENLAKLDALYPDYAPRVQDWIRHDPIALARGRVNLALIAPLAPSWVLFVTHGLGGGTESALRGLVAEHAGRGERVLVLRSTPGGRLELAPALTGHEDRLVCEYPAATRAVDLAEQLRALPITQVHVHHTLGFGRDIWDLPALLGVPFDVTLHDFYLACPRITMIDELGQFCGQPEAAACERCVAAAPLDYDIGQRLVELGGSVAAWRAFHAERLSGARRVVAPSRDTAARAQRYLPGVGVRAEPHNEPAYARPAGTAIAAAATPYTVAVIGAIGPHKGVDLLLACAKQSLREALPLRFAVIGYTSRDAELEALDNVSVSGRYHADELPNLLRASGASLALFLSVWPETYSYTLSEAWRAGLLPVALDLGAPAERIRERGDGVLVPFPASATSVLAALMAALPSAAPDAVDFGQTRAATERVAG